MLANFLKFNKFASLMSVIVMTFLNSAILRVMKDTLLFADNSSIEVVHFIKSCLVMPISIIFVYFYTKTSMRVKSEKIIYTILYAFLSFFLLYALIIHPFRYMLHPNPNAILGMIQRYPYCKWILVLYGSWSNAIFYVFSELWTAIALNLIFWQFANSVNTIKEARSNYVYFGILGNIGMVAGGGLISYLFRSNLKFKVSIMSLVIALIVFIIILLYRFIFNNIEINTEKLCKQITKEKFRLSDLFKVFICSKYLRNLMLLVFCYHFTSNLVEVTWKAVLHSSRSNSDLYGGDLGLIYMTSGLVSIFLFYVPRYFIKHYSWRSVSLLIPSVLLFIASIFYFVLFNSSLYSNLMCIFKLSTVAQVGAVYYICNRFFKYAFFDPVKEIAYMPLEEKERLQGKAMIDVFGSKFSKAMSGYVQGILLAVMPYASQISISKYLIYFVVIFMIIWIRSVLVVSKEYEELSNKL